MYLPAILLPPVAVFIWGRPIQAIINVLLCFFLVIPRMIHAILVVRDQKADGEPEQPITDEAEEQPDWDEGLEAQSRAPLFTALVIFIAIAVIAGTQVAVVLFVRAFWGTN